VADTSERFAWKLGRLVWNKLDEEARRVLTSNRDMSRMVLGETQAALGWMNQYVVPIQIALNVVNTQSSASMRKRITTMIDIHRNG
jgi:hypothetical protein